MSGATQAPPAGRRLLHAMLRVRDLPAMLQFYCGQLGMRELRRIEFASERYTLVFIGYGGSATEAEVELWWDWDRGETPRQGDSFGHLGIGVDDIHGLCAALRARGVMLSREPAPTRAGGRVIALLHDPEGNEVELLGPPVR